MNTINFSDKDTNNLTLAENYYYHMLHKNFDAMDKCLHPDVHFISPLAEMSGKNLVVDAAQNLRKILNDIKMRARFSNNHQVMFVYDFFFPEPIGTLRSSGLIELKEHLISKIELFYDARPFVEKKHDIFSHTKE
jgi:hypothetical protein